MSPQHCMELTNPTVLQPRGSAARCASLVAGGRTESCKLGPSHMQPSHFAHQIWFPRLMPPQATRKVGHNAALSPHQIVLVFCLRPTLAEQSSEPLISRGGPLRRGQQLLTKASCSAIFLVCCPVSASQARTVLSGDADTSFSPSVLQCSSRTAFLWPARQGLGFEG